MKQLLLAGLLAIASAGRAELKVTDSRGAVPVTRVNLDSVKGKVSFLQDIDGDGRNDTLKVFFRQAYYQLVYMDHGDEWGLASVELPEEGSYVEFATAKVAGLYKPALIVKFGQGAAGGDSLYIFDMVQKTSGLRPITLLATSAAWGDAPTVVKPGLVEIATFRNWLCARYLWDGEKYVEQKVDDR